MNDNICLGIFMFFKRGIFDKIPTFGALRMAENRYSEVLSATSSLLIDQFANMGIDDDVDDEGARMVTNSTLCIFFGCSLSYLSSWVICLLLFFYIFFQGGWDWLFLISEILLKFIG